MISCVPFAKHEQAVRCIQINYGYERRSSAALYWSKAGWNMDKAARFVPRDP